MNFYVMTLFPEMIEQGMNTSITGRAIKKGILSLETVNIRDYSVTGNGRIDDYPYGGGAGMVMQAEPVFRAYESLKERVSGKSRLIYLSPQGEVFRQEKARTLAQEENLIFLCGHYEGIDERVLEEIVTDTLSIGDYVLTGGELPSMVVMDAVARMVPGVLSNAESGVTESFSENLLEYPQYSRPELWHEKQVPAVLLSGHHGNVDRWRREQSLLRTLQVRPELLADASLTEQDKKFLRKVLDGNTDPFLSKLLAI